MHISQLPTLDPELMAIRQATGTNISSRASKVHDDIHGTIFLINDILTIDQLYTTRDTNIAKSRLVKEGVPKETQHTSYQSPHPCPYKHHLPIEHKAYPKAP